MESKLQRFCCISVPPRHCISDTGAFTRHGARRTCMPASRTPRRKVVVSCALRVWLRLFVSGASSPYCRVPIFRSSTFGTRYTCVRFSSKMHSDAVLHCYYIYIYIYIYMHKSENIDNIIDLTIYARSSYCNHDE